MSTTFDLAGAIFAERIRQEQAAAREQQRDALALRARAMRDADELRATIDTVIAPDVQAALGGVRVEYKLAEQSYSVFGSFRWHEATCTLTQYGDGVRLAVSAPWGDHSALIYSPRSPAVSTIITALVDVERQRERWLQQLAEHAECMITLTRAADAARVSAMWLKLGVDHVELYRWRWGLTPDAYEYGWSHRGTLDEHGAALIWRRGRLAVLHLAHAAPIAEHAPLELGQSTAAWPAELVERISIDVPGIDYRGHGGPGVPWPIGSDVSGGCHSGAGARLYVEPSSFVRIEVARRPCIFVRLLLDLGIGDHMSPAAVLELIDDQRHAVIIDEPDEQPHEWKFAA